MTYNLSKDLDLQRYLKRSDHLVAQGACVELLEKTGRTTNQNSYLHLIIGEVAIETGVSLDYCKAEYFKKLANRDIFLSFRDDKFAGRVEVLRSSKDLTKEEMSTAIDRFKRWASEQGIYIPEPEDTERLREIEVEMGRMQRWL